MEPRGLEALAAPDGQLRSELADVLEVLRALAAAHGMSDGPFRYPKNTVAAIVRTALSGSAGGNDDRGQAGQPLVQVADVEQVA
jgi:hypothetical protein